MVLMISRRCLRAPGPHPTSRAPRHRTFPTTTLPAALATVLAVTAVSGCADGGETGDRSGRLRVVAAFYPLQYVVERVGGDLVEVTNLAKPGAEPHDLELAPRDIAGLRDADLVVRLAGFQPAVDDAATDLEPAGSLDVSSAADLDLTSSAHDHESADERTHDHGTEDEHAHTEGSGQDPHFWLDPIRLADVTDTVARRLAELAPQNAHAFTDNASTLRGELEDLDTEIREGLKTCESRDLVTSHQAFGYFAQRYDLNQLGIVGLDPHEEPTPATLTAATRFVREHDVRTIYSETLVEPAIAATLARETGATTAVLDPIEGISDASAAPDYGGIMRANLATLRRGQSCP